MNKADIINDMLQTILGFLSIDPRYEILEEGNGDIYRVNITGDNLSYMIGFRGYSLEALESLISLAVFKHTNTPTTVLVDINGYKNQKIEKLQNLTRKLIDKVRFFEQDVEMPPMDPWERRQVHLLVTEYDDIVSESTGEGRDRRVVLKAKRKAQE
jgi:spoIIIJ-associated protein